MTYAALLNDSPYAITTEAIVRLDPSPGRQDFISGTPGAKPQATVPNADEASLSHSSLLLAHALTLTDVRADRVTQLREAIATGSYRVTAAAVADKLLEALQS